MRDENLFEYILEQVKKNNTEDCYNYLNNNPNLTNKFWDDTLEYLYTNIKPREINTIDDLAKLLDGNIYGAELKNPYGINIEQLCKEKKWVILFPYSDDSLEIHGYIYDEIGAYEGDEYKFVKKGEFYQDQDDDEIYRKAKTNELIYSKEDPHIFVKWCDKEHKPYIWYIDTDYTDVAYFEILDEDSEKDEIWARCCVIDCSKILD